YDSQFIHNITHKQLSHLSTPTRRSSDLSRRRFCETQPGFAKAFNPPAMEARGIRLQGEHGISRKPIAQGMPGCSGCTCMLVCVLDRKSTRLNSSHQINSYDVFCLYKITS